jgi:hypothetical protein
MYLSRYITYNINIILICGSEWVKKNLEPYGKNQITYN